MKKIIHTLVILAATVTASAQNVTINKNLKVNGTVTIGKSDNSTPVAGTIRWTGQDFEAFDGKYWLSLTTKENAFDGDSNLYHTVRIGVQLWMNENLKTTKYNDGTPIPRDDLNWGALFGKPMYTWLFGDSASFINPYGALYNWWVIDPASTGNRNVCPAGWRIPSEAAYDSLKNFLNGNGGALKDTLFWESPNIGATNITKFSAVPGGQTNGGMSFESWLSEGYYWTSTNHMGQATFMALSSYNANISLITYPNNKYLGLSIRCIKNQ